MPNAARLGDITHDGTVSFGSPNTFINSMAAARMGDFTACPHGPGSIVFGSANTFINSIGAARLGDPAVCPIGPGMVVLGSPNVTIGG